MNAPLIIATLFLACDALFAAFWIERRRYGFAVFFILLALWQLIYCGVLIAKAAL